jgi:dynein light chain LC8-type
MSERIEVIIDSEMSHEMQQDAVDCAKQALEMYEQLSVCQYIEVTCLVGCLVGCELPSVDAFSFFQNVANVIKQEFNKKYKPYWHCIVGPTFSLSVSHEKNCYICFDLGEDRIVLFKTG